MASKQLFFFFILMSLSFLMHNNTATATATATATGATSAETKEAEVEMKNNDDDNNNNNYMNAFARMASASPTSNILTRGALIPPSGPSHDHNSIVGSTRAHPYKVADPK